MDRKMKIETMLMFVNDGIYHVNGMSIFAENFEIVNDTLLKFYSYVNAYDSKLKYTVALIPLTDIRLIGNIKV